MYIYIYWGPWIEGAAISFLPLLLNIALSPRWTSEALATSPCDNHRLADSFTLYDISRSWPSTRLKLLCTAHSLYNFHISSSYGRDSVPVGGCARETQEYFLKSRGSNPVNFIGQMVRWHNGLLLQSSFIIYMWSWEFSWASFHVNFERPLPHLKDT